ncbi:hypothetical protein U5B43_09930 [Campylobacter sp. 9BO]|uniref:hypothetical protein n=1 Tax=Campylobacter sp. 9BO TaxID=3424759 RepID=UPI003D34FA23
MPNEFIKPKTYSDVVINSVIAINAKITTSESLECGALVASTDGGGSFAPVDKEWDGSGEKALGVLVDNISADGTAAVLVCGEVALEVSEAVKSALFKQKIIVRG